MACESACSVTLASSVETPAAPRPAWLPAFFLMASLAVAACEPTVKVEPPKEPITINLNIKLDAEVRLKVEEQAEETIEANPDIF